MLPASPCTAEQLTNELLGCRVAFSIGHMQSVWHAACSYIARAPLVFGWIGIHGTLICCHTFTDISPIFHCFSDSSSRDELYPHVYNITLRQSMIKKRSRASDHVTAALLGLRHAYVRVLMEFQFTILNPEGVNFICYQPGYVIFSKY